MAEQLILDVAFPTRSTLANFYPGDNQAVLSVLQQWIKGQDEKFIYLWGETAVGKSHLTQACCQAVVQQGGRATYLPLAEPHLLSPSLLQGVEQQDVVCIDDIQTIAGKSDWEENLFYAYNRIHETDCRLLITATSAPQHIPFALADLQSRLSAGVIYHLQSLSDEQKLAALQNSAAQRGLTLPIEVARYLLTQCPRDMTSLFTALDRMDQASLQRQHRLTIPFVKNVLAK